MTDTKGCGQSPASAHQIGHPGGLDKLPDQSRRYSAGNRYPALPTADSLANRTASSSPPSARIHGGNGPSDESTMPLPGLNVLGQILNCSEFKPHQAIGPSVRRKHAGIGRSLAGRCEGHHWGRVAGPPLSVTAKESEINHRSRQPDHVVAFVVVGATADHV